MHEILVNCLFKFVCGKSVVRWIDSHVMTIAVDLGRKASKKKMALLAFYWIVLLVPCIKFSVLTDLMCFSCEQDSNLMGSDFDNEESGVAGIKRYWAVLYVFKFYNSNDIFFSCTVTVCPSGSSSCDIVSFLKYWCFLKRRQTLCSFNGTLTSSANLDQNATQCGTGSGQSLIVIE